MDKPLLHLEQLSYAYRPKEPILNQVTFSLFAGERLALTGANGEGKTTLLHLIVGLLKKRQGQIIWQGNPVESEGDFQALRRQASLLFQDPEDQLFCPTVIEDVAFGPLNMGLSQDKALEKAHQTLASLKLEHLAERVVHHLSGGQKRLVTLAGVLAMDPKVLLLDEPTNALDTKARQRIIETLQSLDQAMIIISHDDDFLQQIATRWLKLDQGNLSCLNREHRLSSVV